MSNRWLCGIGSACLSAALVLQIFVAVYSGPTHAAAPAYEPIHRVAGNFPRDLYGWVDTRPDTYGYTDTDTLTITFTPPAGKHPRILRLQGNIEAVPTMPAGGSASGGHAQFLAGFETDKFDGSRLCDYCASGVPLYLQGAISARVDTAIVPFDVPADDLLMDDKLRLKMSTWENTMGVPVHIETSYVITFRFE